MRNPDKLTREKAIELLQRYMGTHLVREMDDAAAEGWDNIVEQNRKDLIQLLDATEFLAIVDLYAMYYVDETDIVWSLIEAFVSYRPDEFVHIETEMWTLKQLGARTYVPKGEDNE